MFWHTYTCNRNYNKIRFGPKIKSKMYFFKLFKNLKLSLSRNCEKEFRHFVSLAHLRSKNNLKFKRSLQLLVLFDINRNKMIRFKLGLSLIPIK